MLGKDSSKLIIAAIVVDFEASTDLLTDITEMAVEITVLHGNAHLFLSSNQSNNICSSILYSNSLPIGYL